MSEKDTSSSPDLQFQKEIKSTGLQEFVDFDDEHDQSNPLNWSKARKWGIVGLLSTVTLIA